MQRYFVKRKEQNNLILEESDIHHIKNVMRMNINDKIEVVYDKVLYICNIDNYRINNSYRFSKRTKNRFNSSKTN